MEFTDCEKYAIISVLTLIMEADTIIHPKEIEFMDEMMNRLNISVQDLDHMEVQDFQLSKSTILSMCSSQKKDVKDWFVQMAECDGFVDPREMKIIDGIFNID